MGSASLISGGKRHLENGTLWKRDSFFALKKSAVSQRMKSSALSAPYIDMYLDRERPEETGPSMSKTHTWSCPQKEAGSI